MNLSNRRINVTVAILALAVAAIITGSAQGSTTGASSASVPPSVPAGNSAAPQQQIAPQSQQTVIEPVPARGVPEMLADLRANTRTLSAVIGEKSNLHDAAKRAAIASKVIALEIRQSSLIDELLKQPDAPINQLIPLKQRSLAMLYLFRNGPTVRTVDSIKPSDNPAGARTAKSIQIFSRWLEAAGDTPAVSTAVAELIQLDQDNPTDTRLTMLTCALARETGDKSVAASLLNTAAAMTNPVARAVAQEMKSADRQAELPAESQFPEVAK